MPNVSAPQAVAVIGAGRMGSALVRALFSAGHKVLVWNRDHAKAKATETWGALAPGNLGEVVAQSNCIIFCVADYSVCLDIVNGLGAQALSGKTVVQLTTGTPDDAAAFAAALAAAGAASLDGAIMSYPSSVGTPESRILLSGSQSAFDDASATVAALGELTYIDANSGSANAMDAALLFYHYGATLSFFQGVSLLMASGTDWSSYAEFVGGGGLGSETLKSHARAITAQDHQGTEARLDVHFAALQGVARAAQSLAIPDQFISAVKSPFEAALKAGHASDELSAVFEVFRPAARK